MPDLTLNSASAIYHTHVQIVKYCRVAPAALWVFDYLLTLDNEVANIWHTQRWNHTHGIFFIVRYLPIISFLCANFYVLMGLEMNICLRIYKAYFSTLLILVVTTEGVLCLRTLTLWRSRKLVRSILVALYLAVCAAATACIAVSLALNLDSVCMSSARSAAPMSSDAFKADMDQLGEIGESRERVMMGAFLAVAVFEFVVVCLTLVHGFMNSRWTSSSRLMASLREGNLLYASALLAVSILNVVYFDIPVIKGWTGLFDTFQVVLHGMMASRIILSLRAADNLEGTERIPKPDSFRLQSLASPSAQFGLFAGQTARWDSTLDPQT